MKTLELQMWEISEMAVKASREIVKASTVTEINKIVERTIEAIKNYQYIKDALSLQSYDYNILRATADKASETVKEARWTWAQLNFGKRS